MQCSLFGLVAESGHDLPIAPLTYALEGSGQLHGNYLMRADPVCLVPGHHSLVLSASETLQLDPEEVEALIHLLNDFVQDEGMRFESATPYHWYLALDEDPQITTTAYAQLVDQSVNQALPEGVGARRWHTFLAEIQMLLHQWPGNLQRQLANRPMVNSLWFWGGAAFVGQPVLSGNWDELWSDDTVLMALAHATGVPRHDMVDTTAALLAQSPAGGRLLIQINDGPQLHWDDDYEAWLTYITQDWLIPIGEALRQGQVERLTIHTLEGQFSLTRKQLRRWWRRNRPLATLRREP